MNPSNPVTLINPETDPRWDRFVHDHPYGWITHLSAWKNVLEKSFKHMNGYYFALLDDSDNIKAALPVYFVKSLLTGKRIVSIPFATLCDPLVTSQEEMKSLTDAVLDFSKKVKSSFVEIRTLKAAEHILDDRLACTEFYKHHYLLLNEEPEILKKKFHRTCVRQRISRAEKSGLEFKIVEEITDIKGFYSIYLMTRKRLGLPTQPYAFFKALWNNYSTTNNIQVLLALKNGQVIGGLILFKFKDRVSAEFAASDDGFFNLSPNHYLFWKAIKMAFQEGYKIFDFGRTSPNNSSLMDFKDRWGACSVDLPHYYYPKEIASSMIENDASLRYRVMSNICKKAPDAFQRIIGLFCYRHLG